MKARLPDRLGGEVVVGPVERDAAGRDLAGGELVLRAAPGARRVEQVALVLPLRGTGGAAAGG